MLSAYKYLYYRIYSWNLRKWGENDVPHINALIGVSFLIYVNCYTIIVLINVLTGISIIELVRIDKLKLIFGMVIIGGVNYFLFIHKEKYKFLACKFEDESESRKKINFYFCVIYVISSFIIFIMLVIISPERTKFLITSNT